MAVEIRGGGTRTGSENSRVRRVLRVEEEEFCQLLVSRRRLERVWSREDRAQRLYEPETGSLYVLGERSRASQATGIPS